MIRCNHGRLFPVTILLLLLAALDLFSQGRYHPYSATADRAFSSSDTSIGIRYVGPARARQPLHVRAYRIADPIAYMNNPYDYLDESQPAPKNHDSVVAWASRLRYVGTYNYSPHVAVDGGYVNEMIPLPIRAPGVYVFAINEQPVAQGSTLVISDQTLVMKSDAGHRLFYVVNTRTGARVPFARLTLVGQNGSTNQIAADEDGTIYFSPSRIERRDPPAHILGYNQGNLISTPYTSATAGASAVRTVYLHTDRHVYRPGHRVQFRGVVRDLGNGRYTTTSVRTAEIQFTDARGKGIGRQTVQISKSGAFHGEITLGQEAPLGTYTAVATVGGVPGSHQFDVIEYRKPEYTVDVTTERPHYTSGETVSGTVRSRYHFGEPVAGATVECLVYRTLIPGTSSASNYGPKPAPRATEMVRTLNGLLDAEGSYRFEIPTDAKGNGDYIYSLEARVVDRSRRMIEGSASAQVTHSDLAISATSDRNFYGSGVPVEMDMKLNRYDGKSPAGVVVHVSATRVWHGDGGSRSAPARRSVLWEEDRTSDADGHIHASCIPVAGGMIELRAAAADAHGVTAEAIRTVYVAGPELAAEVPADGSITIIPERDSYDPGQEVNALVLTPTPYADALVTAEGNTIYRHSVQRFGGHAAIVSMPVREEYAPNFFLGVATVVNRGVQTGGREIAVRAAPYAMKLEVVHDRATYRPGDSGTITVRALDGQNRPLAGADLALAMVDVSLYDIMADRTKPIASVFYPRRANNVQTSAPPFTLPITYRQLQNRTMEDDELDAPLSPSGGDGEIHVRRKTLSHAVAEERTTAVPMSGLMTNANSIGGMAIRGGRESAVADTMRMETENGPIREKTDDGIAGYVQPKMRADFRDIMEWAPELRTDAEGYAKVVVKFPDNLTTWRIVVRGVGEETQVGETTEDVIVRKDLLVRMETPRFVTQGDRLLIATNVHNYLAEDQHVTLRFSATQAELGAHDTTITVTANGEGRVDWPVAVSGTDSTTITVTALTGAESDAMRRSVPILPRGLKGSASAATDLAEPVHSSTMTLDVPEGTDSTTRSLSIALSPSVGSSVIGALDDLIGYPYGCAEQTMSRFLPTIVVANVLRDLHLPFDEKKKAEMPKMVAAGLEKLYGYQHSDGGWGWWQADATHPFMTAYIMYGLTVARKAGYDVDGSRYDRGLASLREQIRTRPAAGSYSQRGTPLDPTSEAYMLYVATYITAGNRDPLCSQRIEELAKRTDVNGYCIALLTLAAHNQGDSATASTLAARLASMAKVENGGTCWKGITWEHAWQEDNLETSAFAVKALFETGGQEEMLNRGIAWLMSQKRGNSWGNTRQSAMIVFTMADYLRANPTGDADYSITVKLNGTPIYTRRIAKAEMLGADQRITVDAGQVHGGRNTITVEKTGSGNLHAAAWVDYYSDVASIHPDNQGFAVSREYFVLRRELRDGAYIYTKQPFNGTVHSGDELLVKVKIVPNKAYEYFLLEDPLPAGCEVMTETDNYVIDGENDYQGTAPSSGERWKWWYSSRDVRDSKIAFFAQRLEPKTYEFSYILRAQIPGSYGVMPTIGMLNYYPDVRGNSDSRQMMILE
ncbi:MAG TPA: MG2 domain-containing protein [Candidatus Kapabacteria bacterium]|nr:MG2 domain-containing protein [Candidatus Kapabacteria bacterium]